MKSKEDRQKILLSVIQTHGKLSVNDLQNCAEGSRATLQRDLSDLEHAGKIQRSYGVIKYVETTAEGIWKNLLEEQKSIVNIAEKVRIGQRAQGLIEDRDTIFVSHGTTTRQIFNQIDPEKRITVFTDGIDILGKCAAYRNITVYLIGGMYNPEAMRVEYIQAVTSQLQNIHFGKLFMGVGAISDVNGVSFYDFSSYHMLTPVIERTDEIIVVADSTKFGRSTMVDCIPLHRIKTIITDTKLSKTYRQAIQRVGVECICT